MIRVRGHEINIEISSGEDLLWQKSHEGKITKSKRTKIDFNYNEDN